MGRFLLEMNTLGGVADGTAEFGNRVPAFISFLGQQHQHSLETC